MEVGADLEDNHDLVRHLSLMKLFHGVQVRESSSPDQRERIASTIPRGSRGFRGSWFLVLPTQLSPS